MKRKYIIGGIILVTIIVIGLIIVKANTSVHGGIDVNNIIWSTIQTASSVSFTSDDDIMLYGNGLGIMSSLSNGDSFRFETGSASLPVPLLEGVDYFAVNATTGAGFEVSLTKGGTVIDITDASGDDFSPFKIYKNFGPGIKIENCFGGTFSLDAEEQPSAAFKFMSSIQPTEPNWFASQSQTNQYEYIDVYDAEDDAEIEGDTGITNLNGTDAHRSFWLSTDSSFWFTIRTFNYASGSVTGRFQCGN